jgi:hypothetical protein
LPERERHKKGSNVETIRDAAIAFAFLLNAPLIARWVFLLPAILRADDERVRLEHEATLIWAEIERDKLDLERAKHVAGVLPPELLKAIELAIKQEVPSEPVIET